MGAEYGGEVRRGNWGGKGERREGEGRERKQVRDEKRDLGVTEDERESKNEVRRKIWEKSEEGEESKGEVRRGT